MEWWEADGEGGEEGGGEAIGPVIKRMKSSTLEMGKSCKTVGNKRAMVKH